MKILYTTQATSIGGREGRSKTEDGNLDVKLALPKELGGAGGATNPEQLFAAGYSACFENAIRHIARGQKIAIQNSSVTATVSLGTGDQPGYRLAVGLKVSLPDLDRATGQKLMEAAHQICPYSNATRGNIDVALELA